MDIFQCKPDTSWNTLYASAFHWFETVGLQSSSPDDVYLIAVEHPPVLAAALIACWKNSVTPMISADLQPQTLQNENHFITKAFVTKSLDADLTEIVVPSKFTDTPDQEIVPTLDVTPEDLALYLFTSGSTGLGKRVKKTFSSLFSEVDTLENSFGSQRKNLSVFSTVSPFHIYGLLFSVLWPLRYGHPMNQKSCFHWEEYEKEIANDEDVVIISSPAHLKLLPFYLDNHPLSIQPSMIFCSGGPLERDTSLDIRSKTGTATVEVFGSTETGGIAWRTQEFESDTPFTVLENVEVISNSDNHLLVKSPWTDTPSQWTPSGDIVSIENDGRFRLLGRFDRIAKISGKRISLTKMEQAIGSFEIVQDVKVIEFTENREISRKSLAVFITVDFDLTSFTPEHRNSVIKEIKESLLNSFTSVALPRKWRFINDFPVDSQGKTTYRSLMELL